jgi:hypothetical protein
MNFNSKFFTYKAGFNASRNFKGFFTFNVKRQMSFLNTVYKGQSKSFSTSLLNNVHTDNFSTLLSSNSMSKSISFLFNDSTSNGELAITSQNRRSDFLKILEDLIKMEEKLLESGW